MGSRFILTTRVLLYYITGRAQFPETEPQRQAQLLTTISAAAHGGVDFVQLREKDLSVRELVSLARAAVAAVRGASHHTRLLINSRVDIALAVGADGVHLRSTDISATEVRGIWKAAGAERDPVVAVSCHTRDDVNRAAESGADFVVFGPVFEKLAASATGLQALHSVSNRVPVLALGGVNLANAASCIEAGAAGVAGIRLFQEGDVAGTVTKLRSLAK